MAATNYYDEGQVLFVGGLDRAANYSGFEWAGNALVGTDNNPGFFNSFVTYGGNAITSASFTNSATATGIADQIFNNLLGRNANPAGVTWVAGLFAADNSSISQVILDVYNTVLAEGSGTDYAVMTDRLAAADNFSSYYQSGTGYTAANATAYINQITSSWVSLGNTMSDLPTVANYLSGNTGQTFLLTANMDNLTGNGTFIAGDISGTSSWSAGDSITGTGTNNTFEVISANAITNPAASTVTGIQTADMTSGQGITLDTSSWTGLTTLNVTAPGAVTVTGAATTAISVKDATLAGNAITVNGGSTVLVTDTSVGNGNVIVGSSTAAASTVIVDHTVAGTGNQLGGAVNVTGGTIITVNETLTQATAGATTTAGTVTVTGNASTTAVIVTETAAVAVNALATEHAAVTFSQAGLVASQSITIAGLTYTSTGQTTQAQLAGAFANLTAGATSGAGVATGTYSGTFTGYNTVAAVVNGETDVVTFTSITANTNVPDLTATGTGTLPTVKVTQGNNGQQNGVANGDVNISDANAGSATAAATIATATLTNYATSTISSNALSILNLTGSGGTVTTTEGLTAPTNTTLALNVNDVNNTIIDSSHQFKTINITTSGTSGSVFNITDSALTTVGISGTDKLTTDFTGNANLTAITDNSTSTSTLTIGTGVAFTGTGTGVDVITVDAATTAALAGTSTAGSELIANFHGTGVTSFGTVTGFTELGFAAGSSGTFDLSKLPSITALDVTSNIGGALAVTKAASGTTLAFDTGTSSGFTYGAADSSGAGDSLSVTLGTSKTTGITVNSLIANDAAGDAIANLTIAANNTAGYYNTISALDTNVANANGISSLTVTGNAGLDIGTGTPWADDSSSLVITDNSTANLTANGIVTSEFYINDASAQMQTITIAGTMPGTTYVNLKDAYAGGLTIGDSAAGQLNFVLQNNAANTGLTINDSSNAALNFGAQTATFTDTALAALTLHNTGGALLDVHGISAGGASPVVNATGSGAVTIDNLTFTDSTNTIHEIENTGSGIMSVTNLTDTSGATGTLTLKNTSTGTLTVGAGATHATTATTINLSNDHITATLSDATAGVTVNGGTDNANVSITLSSAITANIVNIGSGADSITSALTDTNATTITDATHASTATSYDSFTSSASVGTVAVGPGGVLTNLAPNEIIQGAATASAGVVNHDQLIFTSDAANTITVNATSNTNYATFAAYIDALQTAGMTIHNVYADNNITSLAGDTVLVETNATFAANAAITAGAFTVIELVGTAHTFSAGTVGHVIVTA